MNANLVNTSDSPITIRSFSASGKGVGDVIKIVKTNIGPVPPNHDSLAFTSGGVFRTYPPAQEFHGQCRYQRLVPVNGFVLQPDAQARALLLTRAVGVGTYSFPGVEVTYSQGGDLWKELVDFGQRGSVIAAGPDYPPLARFERRCAAPGDILPSGTGG